MSDSNTSKQSITDLFTSEELRDIAARASTIDERLAGGYIANNSPVSTEKAEKRLKAWCKSATDGDEALFHKHLAWEGLEVDKIKSLLGDVKQAEDRPLPDWVETFEWSIKAMSSSIDSNTKFSFINTEQPIPFEDIFLSLVVKARERLNITKAPSTLFSEIAHGALQRGFLRRLSELCAPTLHEGFSILQMTQQPMMMVLPLPAYGNPNTNNAYNTYITELRTGGLRDYFLNRPVLARLVSTITDQWIEATAELINRFDADHTAIYETFDFGVKSGLVTKVSYGISDPHNGGRMVSVLIFDNGLKVVYKPKDLGIDVAWYDFLQWLDAEGAPKSTLAPKVLQRQDYGWTEYIEPRPCANETDAKQFFHRAGSMLCLLQQLQGTDFHFENVIANGDRPILVDLETIMHPWLPNPFSVSGPKSALAIAVNRLQDSVLATGYLPNWVVIPGGKLASVGGLNQAEFSEYDSWRFQNINTDGMKLEKVSEAVEAKPHLPILEGKQLSSADYSEEIVSGFESMYHFLVENQGALLGPVGQLNAFKGQTVRVVLRPTRLYALLLRRSLESSNLSDGVDWSIHFDFISRFINWENEKEPLRTVLVAERTSLMHLDIPFFKTRTDIDWLQLPQGRKLIKFFEKSSFEHTNARILSLNESELKVQISLIIQSLQNIGNQSNLEQEGSWKTITQGETSKGSLTLEMSLDQARLFAAVLEREAVCEGGGATWIGTVPLHGEYKTQLDLIGYDFYSGVSGISLFLAALENVTGEGRYGNLALAALAPLREDLRDREGRSRLARSIGIGGGVGLGSVIYTLVCSAALLNENSLLEDAHLASNLITNERIRTDNFLDVMAGAAGSILGLLALYRTCHDESTLERATTCGNHILAKQSKGTVNNKAWLTIGETYLTGFSHGAAGIALALLRLYETTGNRTFLSAALDGISYERSMFSAEAGNWPDHRELPSTGGQLVYPCQWCHGAAGIGLARLGGLDILDDGNIRNEIDVAIQTTLNFQIGVSDHLCCGNFGRLEMLYSAGLLLDRTEIINVALCRAKELLYRRKKSNRFNWPSGTDDQNPGFFTGISGLGYHLLRWTHPKVLPSVLMWK